MTIIALAPLVRPPLPAGCSLAFDNGYTHKAPTGAPSGLRVYLYPGFNQTAAQWQSSPFNGFVSNMLAAGHELVYLVPPSAQPCLFTNGGWQYREEFVAQLNAAMSAVEAAHGPAQVNGAGGFSWGGIHAMIAKASSSRIGFWFAHVTVTKPSALTELASVGDVFRFNPFFEVPALAPSKGFISWGTQDDRVHWQYTKELADRLSGSVTKVEYPGLDHSTNSQGIADVVDFVNGVAA